VRELLRKAALFTADERTLWSRTGIWRRLHELVVEVGR
jgi:hypothetical protein